MIKPCTPGMQRKQYVGECWVCVYILCMNIYPNITRNPHLGGHKGGHRAPLFEDSWAKPLPQKNWLLILLLICMYNFGANFHPWEKFGGFEKISG